MSYFGTRYGVLEHTLIVFIVCLLSNIYTILA